MFTTKLNVSITTKFGCQDQLLIKQPRHTFLKLINFKRLSKIQTFALKRRDFLDILLTNKEIPQKLHVACYTLSQYDIM